MKTHTVLLIACGALFSGCVAYPANNGEGGGYNGDRAGADRGRTQYNRSEERDRDVNVTGTTIPIADSTAAGSI